MSNVVAVAAGGYHNLALVGHHPVPCAAWCLAPGVQGDRFETALPEAWEPWARSVVFAKRTLV